MKCKKCKRKIEDNSIFCNWCGHRQLKEITEQMSVPAPKKLKNGEYSAQLMIKGQRVRIHGLNEADYYRKAKAAKAGLVEIKPKSAPYTLSDAIDKYIEQRSEILSPSTIRGYRRIQATRFADAMKKDIHSIDNWQALINEEVRKNYAPKTVMNSWRFICSVLRNNGITPPVCVLPINTAAEKAFLEPSEIQPYIASLKDKSCEVAALFALHSLRQSEVFALTWDDIDFKANTISVTKSVVTDENNRLVEKPVTKNASSTRTVPIFIPRLLELLQSVPQEQRTGKIVTFHPAFIRKQLRTLHGGITLHNLRHSFASLAYSLDLSELECQRIGGWADNTTMRKVYTHLSNEDKTKAEQKLKDFFSEKKTPTEAKPIA